MVCSPHWEEVLTARGAGSSHDRHILRLMCPHHWVGLGAMGRPLLTDQKAEAREASSWRGEQASRILRESRHGSVKVEGIDAIITFIINSLFHFVYNNPRVGSLSIIRPQSLSRP